MLMIKYNDKDHILEMKGHANYGKGEEDIVCAAASALFYTLVYSLKESKGTILKKGSMKYNVEPGNSSVRAKAKKGCERTVSLIFWVCLNGFKALAETYPKNVMFLVESDKE